MWFGRTYAILDLWPEGPIEGVENMARYLVERTFNDGLGLPADPSGAQTCNTVIGVNSQEQVTWVHSYVTPDKTKTFCI